MFAASCCWIASIFRSSSDKRASSLSCWSWSRPSSLVNSARSAASALAANSSPERLQFVPYGRLQATHDERTQVGSNPTLRVRNRPRQIDGSLHAVDLGQGLRQADLQPVSAATIGHRRLQLNLVLAPANLARHCVAHEFELRPELGTGGTQGHRQAIGVPEDAARLDDRRAAHHETGSGNVVREIHEAVELQLDATLHGKLEPRGLAETLRLVRQPLQPAPKLNGLIVPRSTAADGDGPDQKSGPRLPVPNRTSVPRPRWWLKSGRSGDVLGERPTLCDPFLDLS